MNAILGLNGVLLDELASDRQQFEAAQHIRDATSQLLRVVNDILDISQLEAGRLALHNAPFALAHALMSSVSPYVAKVHTKGLPLALTLDVPPTTWVLADRQRLTQVIHHLLDNAVKFTPTGKIDVRAFYADGCLRFEVEDTGPGIAPAAFESLFNRFSNASLDTRRASGGAGLGLAVSHRVVKHAGGRIAAQTDRDTGALFWLEGPMPLHASVAAVQDPPLISSGQARHFLIVDDHPMNQMVVQLLLRKRWPGCQVAVAETGQNALQMLEASPCDLVLMDLYMPGMDGIETTQRLREHPDAKLRATPVVGLTANNLASDTQRCLDAGMHCVVLKPIDQSLFFNAVSTAIDEAGRA